MDQTKLKTILKYDLLSGLFTRIANGRITGTLHRTGYVQISVCDKSYRAHRLVWLYVTGAWPPFDIDHRNHIRIDNRFANLRAVTRSENQQNRTKALSNNKCGLLGVSFKRGRWRAKISVNGRGIELGNAFASAEAAHCAYVEAKRRYHPTAQG